MPEVKGFWSMRPRRGIEDAGLIAAERIHELRQVSYAALRARSSTSCLVKDVTGPDGQPYKLRTNITLLQRSGDEELRIVIRVDRGTLLTRLNPLADEVIIAAPEGEFLGDYTLASEGNDPRRYSFSTRKPRRG
jgi:hypothetical protein